MQRIARWNGYYFILDWYTIQFSINQKMQIAVWVWPASTGGKEHYLLMGMGQKREARLWPPVSDGAALFFIVLPLVQNYMFALSDKNAILHVD